MEEIKFIIESQDVLKESRKLTSKELAKRIDITEANLSILKTGKAKGIRFSTLLNICRELDCQPGEIIEYKRSKDNEE